MNSETKRDLNRIWKGMIDRATGETHIPWRTSGVQFHFPVVRCLVMRGRLDPETGAPKVPGPMHYPGQGDLDRVDSRGNFEPRNVHWISRE